MRRIVPFVCFLGLLTAATSPLSLIVFDVRALQPGRLPDGWQLKVNRGSPEYTVSNDGQGPVIRLKSHRSSFSLERAVDVDVNQYPFLTWRWKVNELPKNGDFRRAAADDQAAQVLVLFSDRRVLTYLWDSTAPKGLMQSASSIPLLHIFAVVCRSGASELNQWLAESRNLAEDYRKAYGRPPQRVKGVRLQINSQHTATAADSEFGEVAFRNAL